MKRTIFIEILQLLTFGIMFSLCIIFLHSAGVKIDYARQDSVETISDSIWWESAKENLIFGILCLIASISNLTATVIIAVKNFKVFQPLVEKHNARKSERAARKQAKSESDKQKRIEELQAELDELQDKTNSNP